MGALLVNNDPNVVAAFVRRFGIEYKPDQYTYRFRRFWDTQSVGAAATTAAATDFFNTSTSSRALHAQGVAGCNLWNVGKIPGGSVFVLTAIEAVHVQGAAATAPFVRDAQYYAEGGVVEGLYLNGKQVTEEFSLGDAMIRAGVAPITFDNVAAAGAGVVVGASGVGDGEQFSPETLPLITSDDVVKVPVSFAGFVAPSASAKFRIRLAGLLATKR